MTTPVRAAIDLLTATDVPIATDTLAAAFVDYPLTRAIAPSPASRPRACAAFCRMLTRYCVAEGTAYATADRLGVACWLPPGRDRLTMGGLLRCGALSLAWELGLRGGILLERLGRKFEALRRRHVPGPHWYLVLLGVHPSARGRGLSRAVLQPVFDVADRDRVPCYLETQDAADVPIYRRFGFTVTGEGRLPGGLRNWEMRRLPSP